MPYRDPNPTRMAAQMERLMSHAAQSATWERWVSASDGVPAAGIQPTQYFARRPIAALFGKMELVEEQTNAGTIIHATVQVTTHEQLSRQDRLIWRGETYEIDSDAMPARIGDGYITLMRRVST